MSKYSFNHGRQSCSCDHTEELTWLDYFQQETVTQLLLWHCGDVCSCDQFLQFMFAFVKVTTSILWENLIFTHYWTNAYSPIDSSTCLTLREPRVPSEDSQRREAVFLHRVRQEFLPETGTPPAHVFPHWGRFPLQLLWKVAEGPPQPQVPRETAHWRPAPSLPRLRKRSGHDIETSKEETRWGEVL